MSMKHVRGAAYSALFYPLLVLYTAMAIPVLGTLVAIRAPFVPAAENRRRFRRMIAWYGYGIIRGLARPVVRIVYESPVRTSGISRIFVANHVSSSDPFLVALLPETMVQVVNKWPFKLPVWGFFARMAGYLNIRAMPPEAFQAAAAGLLAEGTSIMAFPEGTRSGSRPMGPFHGALFRCALATKTPLVPMCITGNERCPAMGSLVLEPALIRVRCLPELAWEEFKEMSPFQLKNHVRSLILEETERMKVAS